MAFTSKALPGIGEPDVPEEEEEEKKKKENVFVYANAVMRDKKSSKDRVADILEENPKYNAYLTNRALSQYGDCVFQASAMNGYPNIHPIVQLDYLYNTVEKRNRGFAKWPKSDEYLHAEIVSRYYGLRQDKAMAMARCLTKKQIDELGLRMADIPKGEYRQT